MNPTIAQEGAIESIDESQVEVLPPEESGPSLFSEDDQKILDLNKKIRRKILTQLSKDGSEIPEDKADRSLLLKTMEMADAEVIARARLKVAAKIGDDMANLTDVVGKALLTMKVETASAAPITAEQLAQVPSHVPPPHVVPGLLDQGVIPVKLDEIVQKPTK